MTAKARIEDTPSACSCCGRLYDFVSTARLAQDLGVSSITVRSWVYRGLLPRPVRVCKTLIWPVRMLEQWFATRGKPLGRWDVASKVLRAQPWGKKRSSAAPEQDAIPADGQETAP